jgi:hypothetical protein
MLLRVLNTEACPSHFKVKNLVNGRSGNALKLDPGS